MQKKIIYNQYKKSIHYILKLLCRHKGIEIIEKYLMSEHIHMIVSIPEN